MQASSQNLTAEELDELRKIGAATDAQRDPPVLASEIAGKLRAFGLVAPDARGRLSITDRGRGALLEQDMRDAEDRWTKPLKDGLGIATQLAAEGANVVLM